MGIPTKYKVFIVIPTIILAVICNSRRNIYYEEDGKQIKNNATKREKKTQNMVSISHQNCRKLFQLRKFHTKLVPQEDPSMESMYRSLSELLPSTPVNKGMMPPSRLQVTNGRVPYLPCRVKLYDAKQLHQCLLLRHSKNVNGTSTNGQYHHIINKKTNKPTWIAFVGDSKMRGKFTAMVFGLKSEFNWTTSWDAENNGSYVEVSILELRHKIDSKVMQSMRGVSNDGLLQIDFVAATRGLITEPNNGNIEVLLKNQPTPLLGRWANKSEKVPHLVVIGHGQWTFLRGLYLQDSFLEGYDSILNNWKRTSDFLTKLSDRTNILVWPQSRKRNLAAFDYIKATKTKINAVIKDYVVSSQALEWIEIAMHYALKSSSLTQWDSSVPFNLANIRECSAIREVVLAKLSSGDSTITNNYKASKSKKIEYQDKVIQQENTTDDNPQNNEETTINEVNKSKTRLYEENKIDDGNIISSSKSLKEILDNRKANKLSTSKYDNSLNGDKAYHNYIDYVFRILKTMPLQDLQSLYDSSFLNCRDSLHNSEMTIQDEIQMIYNLLCNQYESKQNDLCCQK